MFLRFCGTRCREKKGESIQELFPTHPTYQNPIFINPRLLFGQFFWFFVFFRFSSSFGPFLCSLFAGLDNPQSLINGTIGTVLISQRFPMETLRLKTHRIDFPMEALKLYFSAPETLGGVPLPWALGAGAPDGFQIFILPIVIFL